MTDSEEDTEASERHLSTVARESTYVIGGRFGGMFLGFAINYVLATEFGPSVLGQYSIVQTVVGITAILSVAGLDQGLVKYVSSLNADGDVSGLKRASSVAFGVGVALSVIGGLLIVVSRTLLANSVFTDTALENLFIWGGLILIPLTLARLLEGLYRGFQENGLYTVVQQVGQRLILIGGLGIFLALGITEAVAPLVSYLAGMSAVVIWGLWNARKFGLRPLRGIFDFFATLGESNDDLRGDLVKFSITMSLVSVMGFLLKKIDILMTGIYLDSTEVGIYKIALTVSVFVSVFLTASSSVFSSIISELFTKDDLGTLKKVYSTLTRWLVILCLPLTVSLCVFPDTILGVFGAEYVSGSAALIVLTLGWFLHTAAGANGYILAMGGFERLLLINNAVLAILNIIFNLILIPEYGITGAAIATALSSTLVNLVVLLEMKLLLNIFPFQRRFLYLFLVAGAVGMATWIAYDWIWSVYSVAALTIANTVIGCSVMYIFRDDLDQRLMNRFTCKLGLRV